MPNRIETIEKQEKQAPANKTEKEDSFNLPNKQSPLMWFALLQIPLVIGMMVGLYFMYQNSKN